MEHFSEACAMVRVKMQLGSQKLCLPPDAADLAFCYDILGRVSRSFAAVIAQLHPLLRDAVCLFYLLLRALDTIEDDVQLDATIKEDLLSTLHIKVDEEPQWYVDGIGKGDERRLLQEFPRVSSEIRRLKPAYRAVLRDICQRMGMGMLEFQTRGVETFKDYDLYCHYVAGLVGHGLTQIFSSSGLEDPTLAEDLSIANSMGLFLQKVNIIRDYYEDIVEDPPRVFWPRDAWSKFAPSIHSFRDRKYVTQGVECLNFLIADAMRHVPDCIRYLSSLKEGSVFHFCAIPQVMAIATLVELYGNANVLTKKVKIRKGLACKLMLGCRTLSSTVDIFSTFVKDLERRCNDEDPSVDALRLHIAEALVVLEVNTEMKVEKSGSYARQLITQYPALGGQFLYNLLDNASGLFRA